MPAKEYTLVPVPTPPAIEYTATGKGLHHPKHCQHIVELLTRMQAEGVTITTGVFPPTSGLAIACHQCGQMDGSIARVGYLR